MSHNSLLNLWTPFDSTAGLRPLNFTIFTACRRDETLHLMYVITELHFILETLIY